MWFYYAKDKCGSLTPGINLALYREGEMWASYNREKCGPLTPGINVVILHQG